MFRTGIVSRSQLARLERLPRTPPAIALTLLNEFSAETVDERALELIYERMPAGAGTRKRKLTYPGRYRAVDESLQQVIKDAFSPQSRVRIHEVAASNAITSLEMFQKCRSRPNLSVHASDYYDALRVVEVGNWRVVFDAVGDPVQFINGSLVISGSRPEPNRYLINRAVRRYALHFILPKALQLLNDAPGGGKRISLFHPRCLEMAAVEPRFTLGRDNLFAPAPRKFEVIRVMSGLENVSVEDTRHAILELSKCLTDSGLLVIGQNTGRDSQECGTTIFRETGGRFSVATEIMSGSYLTPLVLALKA